MITGYAFAVVLCVIVVIAVFVLLRRRRLREKYAGIWIAVSIGVVVLAAFPELAFWLAALVRVHTPANLLFALAIAVLLIVCVQLSTEVSALEEETRTIAEELALLRLEVQSLRAETNAETSMSAAASTAGPRTDASPLPRVPEEPYA
jgi:hypothetical protein